MMLQFKQAVRIGRQTFPLGIHEVPEEIMKHAHFKFFKNAGLIVTAGANAKKELKDLPVLPAPKSVEAKKAAEQAMKSQLAEVQPDAEIGGDEESEPDFGDEQPSKKSKNKKGN